jgi:Flp pilus assembly protein TadD
VGQIRCLLAQGEWREAVTWSDRALDRFANTPDLLACKGLALARLGDREGMSYIDSAMGMKTAGAFVWLARGECLLVHKTAEVNAARCFLKAIELSGDDWRMHLRVGIACHVAGLPAKARGSLMRAVHCSPENTLALYQLGLVHKALGEHEAAMGCFSRAHSLGCKDAERALEAVRAKSPVSRFWEGLVRKR